MFPPFDSLGGSRLSQDRGDAGGGIQLAEGSFMTMVWLSLGYKYNIWFWNFGKPVDACRDCVERCSELRVPDLRGTGEPWVEKDGEVS